MLGMLRAAAAKTLTRPNFDQLSPSLTLLRNPIDPTLNQGLSGNPALEPVRADNVDLAVERYFSDTTAVLATVFFVAAFSLAGFPLTSGFIAKLGLLEATFATNDYLIAAVSLALPAMIISETTLSFLGLGLRPPAISWGVLLQDAQNIQALGQAPWLLFVAVPVIVVILAFNFLGDGLRDAADPYG